MNENEEYTKRITTLSNTKKFQELLYEIYGVKPTPSMIKHYVEWINIHRHGWTDIRGTKSEMRLLEFVKRETTDGYKEPTGSYTLKWYKHHPCPSCGTTRGKRHLDTCQNPTS